jgi:hypothetical protein
MHKKMCGEETFGLVPKLSFKQQIELFIFGSVFIGYVQPKGWLPGVVPVYVFRCSVHGYFLDTLHGYKMLPQCDLCLKKEVGC